MTVVPEQLHVRILPGPPAAGIVELPGSKSITNRVLTCAALADGDSQLLRVSPGDDSARMIAGLRSLGVHVAHDAAAATAIVRGSRGILPAGEAEIDTGAAGTAMRFLTALACLGRGLYRLDGTARMRERPVGDLVDSLRTLGARIGYELREGFPPLTVRASALTGGEVTFDRTPSSQFISALLMVAPYAVQDVLIRTDGAVPSRPYVDMTIAVMQSLGVFVLESDGRRFAVPAGQRYQGRSFEIEPDASAATYFWAAAAITGGCVAVAGLTRESTQGDVHFIRVLERMGCTASAGPDGLRVHGPQIGELRGGEFDLNEMPDTVQTLAVTAIFARGPTTIRNVANLRIKETDRIAALEKELTKFGAGVHAFEDGLTITPPATPRSAEIDTYDDHRMAMSFALAGLQTNGGVLIRNANCVSKSFPTYFDVLAHLAAEA